MKNPRKPVTEEDLDKLPIKRIRRMYAIPKRSLMSRTRMKQMIKEKRLMPYDGDKEEYETVMGCDKVEQVPLNEMSWPDLVKYAGLKPGPGVNKKVVMAKISSDMAKAEGESDGCTNCTNDHHDCN